MANFPKQCPYCDTIIDSHASEAQSNGQFKAHLDQNHKGLAQPLDPPNN